MDHPCEDPACPLCSLHCPDCGVGLAGLVLDVKAERIRCPQCGQAEDIIPPQMIAMRHRQVLAISGRAIPEWKCLGRQLNARFHHHWRSTKCYLDPAASAALSHADDLMLTTGCSEDAAIALAQEAYWELQQMIAADPSLSSPGALPAPFLDDWY
jgi:hypothetical protein